MHICQNTIMAACWDCWQGQLSFQSSSTTLVQFVERQEGCLVCESSASTNTNFRFASGNSLTQSKLEIE